MFLKAIVLSCDWNNRSKCFVLEIQIFWFEFSGTLYNEQGRSQKFATGDKEGLQVQSPGDGVGAKPPEAGDKC